MKNRRASLVTLGFILVFLLLFYRVMVLVLWPDPRLVGGQQLAQSRGLIYDRHTNVLAMNVAYYDLYVRPTRFSSLQRQWLREQLLKYSNFFESADVRLVYTNRDFVYLKRRLTFSQKETIETMFQSCPEKWQHDSWGFVQTSGRYYPYLETAKVVGYVGIDNNGLDGLEFFFDEDLKQGKNIFTTLDPLVSRIALEELVKGVHEADADYGSVVVLSLSNREILALVDWPFYNPNVFATIHSVSSPNYALSVAYEPGSVMKVFASIFGLENGLVSPSESFFCGGSYDVYGTRVKDGYAHGYLTLAGIIQKSCNVGMVQVADRFVPSRWYATLTNLGFGLSPQLPLPGKASGILRPLEKWSGLSKYMTSIGQEIGVSTMQLTLALATVAGGGVYQSPTLVYGWAVPVQRRVFSSSASRQVLKMMEQVVSENGTALSARIEGMAIAGKTGTGQIAREDGSGYYPNFFSALFMGVFPAENPRYVIVVAVNRIHGPKHTGGEVAAPIFSRIVRRMLIQTDYVEVKR